MSYHIPVMAEAVVASLAAAPPGPLVDGTVGGGGHAAALAEATPADRAIVGVDQDPEALAAAAERLAPWGERVTLLHGNFAELDRLLPAAGFPTVSGILVDLGVSSHQIDSGARGFSWRHEGSPLDMRMDTSSDQPTALELLRSWDVDTLTKALRDFGEVSQARRLATAIRSALDAGELETTSDLARVVADTARARSRARSGGGHPATTVFQALRIAVNRELWALDALLEAAPDLLCDEGRLAVISYHSLEDRRVKHAVRRGEHGPERPSHLPPPSDWRPTWRAITRKPLRASDAENEANPRARSARLRVAARARRSARGVA